MHRYRSHTCGALRDSHIDQTVRLSGWCHRIRDHGGVLFIDLRDHYGLTQCVADPDSPAFAQAEKLRSEWVVRIDGKARRRPAGTENPELPTGEVEIYVTEIEVLGPAGELPLPVFGEQEYPEDIRLKYRFLDLRREKLHKNIAPEITNKYRIGDIRHCFADIGKMQHMFGWSPRRRFEDGMRELIDWVRRAPRPVDRTLEMRAAQAMAGVVV